MKAGIIKESRAAEARVAATPDSIKKLPALGLEVIVESGAGGGSSYPDRLYESAGARIGSHEEALACDVVLKVAPPTPEEIGALRSGALLVSMLEPFGAGKDAIPAMAERGVTAVAMELIPRITRAQAMDVLSSQANLAGYKAVIEAAHHFGKLIPMMMTAAGSVPPCKLFVFGAGVAGLQAIATARRLGAQVEAFDVRPEVREQIESVGAKFLDLGLEESGSGSGGYAKELTADSQEKQRQAIAKALTRADIVITTAQIPGRPAPVLITEEGMKNMKPGSVIVDMAAATGGNCPLTEADAVVVKHGVTLIGHTNLPSMIASHSSQFFARNLVSLLGLIVSKDESGATVSKVDLTDEILDAAVVTHAGEVRWPKKKT